MGSEADQQWGRNQINLENIPSDCFIRALLYLYNLWRSCGSARDLTTLAYPRAIDLIDHAISTTGLQVLFYINF